MPPRADADKPTGPTRAQYAAWIVICGAAELLGIADSALWWVAMDRIAPDPVTLAGKFAMLGAKGLSGAIEGLVLGCLQGIMLARLYPALSLRGWIGATCLAAIVGWTAGSAFPIFGDGEAGQAAAEPSLALTVAFSAVFGLLVGAFFGAVQMVPLRRAATGSGWWIGANAAGWACALPIVYVAASLPAAAGGLAAIAVAGLVSGVLAGLTLGAWTGLSFWRMKPRR